MSRKTISHSLQNYPARSALIAAMAIATSPATLSAQTTDNEAADTEIEDTDILRMDEMIVSARRREESIQTVPVSITAVSPEQLANEGALTIEDIQGLAPNVVVDSVSAAPGASAVSIRGISFEDVERSFEPTVGVVIDGVFLGTSVGQLSNTFDFESVEVLRGPQGTLFGRNTIGGVINVQRSRPTKDWGFKAQASVTNQERQEYSGILNVPIVKDRIGLKAFVFERNFDGFFDNITTGSDDGGADYLNYGFTIGADITENIDFLFTAERQEFTGDPVQVSLSQPGLDLICGIPGAVPSFAPPAECGLSVDDLADTFETFSDFDDAFFLDEDDLTAEINWDIGDFTLTSITAWRESVDSQTQDFDATSSPFFFTTRNQDYRQFSQELRFAGQLGDRIDFVTGFYLFDSNYTLDQITNGGIFPPDPISGNPGQILADVEQDTLSWALFADVDVNITDKLRLNLGGRFTRDQKDFRISNDLNFDVVGVVPIFDTTDPTQLPEGIEIASDGFLKSEFDDFAPRISLDYQFTDDILGFASWSQGFRAGGFNGRAGTITAATTIFEPEEVNSFEVGFKSELFENRIQLNATGFVALYDDRQEDVVIPIDEPPFQETVVLNASDSTFWGIEFDSRAIVTEDFEIVTSFGYLNAEFDSFPILGVDPATGEPALFDQSDLEIRRTPDFTFSITGNYSKQIGPGDFNGSLSFRFTDGLQTTIVNANPLIGPQIDPLVSPDTNGPAFNDPRGFSESEEILNLTLSYSWDVGPTRVTGAFFARNLLDDVGLNSVLPVAGLLTFGTLDAPREIGGSITVEF